MSSPDQTARSIEKEKEKVISLFLNGMGPTAMYQQLLKEGAKISRKEMRNIVYQYMDSLPASISDIDCSTMSSEQIGNLRSVIEGKSEIDMKKHKFEVMKERAAKLKTNMAKLYADQVYAEELALIQNCIQYALDVGVPRYLIKKRFKNLNKISTNFWKKKVNDGRNINLESRPKPPGVY